MTTRKWMVKWAVTGAVFAALHGLQAAAVLQASPLQTVRLERPDPRLTPGAAGAWTTDDVCHPGFARQARHVTNEEKRAIFAEYGVVPAPGERFEIDHLVPLELGGTNEARNLWPQPFAGTWTAGQKDRLENALHRDVCGGREPLPAAQQEIQQDWIAAYARRYGTGLASAKGGAANDG